MASQQITQAYPLNLRESPSTTPVEVRVGRLQSEAAMRENFCSRLRYEKKSKWGFYTKGTTLENEIFLGRRQ
ncbi:hypothetical protein Pla144_36300 [Bythopirellula polymerisocia]|uniref:Uncharacterized protein n=1 Tax=Bythopirellula polymerisocia TaxID=2528003 RepID=A0A5C6CMP8_9BACT|nr:hypothetical protein Pla144_36300 [Bythopirellula polymerisocia]